MKSAFLLLFCLLLSACVIADEPAPQAAGSPVPSPVIIPVLPDKLAQDDNGIPLLDVYIIDEDTLERMPVEDYLEGVVAGEMKNDWPMEALRAQAILARTFVMRFVSEKESRYPGADISTDITEAQAYDTSAVNARVRQAVQSTAGMVLSDSNGQLPYAWFHAHSGGMTATAQEGLSWDKAEPAWTLSRKGHDSPAAPDEAREWSAEFPIEEFLAACRATGAHPNSLTTLTVAETGPSGRAVTIDAGGTPINAARLRIALGSTRMRSTLLTSLTIDGDEVRMSGRGYGHGVGMPQWGAYALAQDGLVGEDIAVYYFKGLHVAKMW